MNLTDEIRELLASVVDRAALDGILLVDREGRKLYQNRRCVELWGIPAEIDANGDDQTQIAFVLGRVKDPRRFVDKIEYLYAHPADTSRDEIELVDRTVLDRYSAPVVGGDGVVRGRVWMFHDVSDLKRTQAQLAESLSVLDATLDSTVDGILVVDRAGRLTKFNRTFAEMWRLPADILASRDDRRAIEFVLSQLKEPAGFVRKVEELYAKPEAESFDVLEFKDGRIIERYSLPHRIGPDIVGRVWNFRDVTERRRLEAQALRTQRMESIGTLAGGMAHDLNNILAPILLSIDVLAADAADRPDQLALLENLRANARRGASLVRQVLGFSRGIEGQRLAVNLPLLVDELAALIRETFPRNIRARLRVPPNLWIVTGDPTQLHQVLLNLAVNARDAMPQGGTLTIAAENREVDPQVAAAHPGAKPGRHVTLSVEDTGVGIPPETRDRIFEPFFTTKEPGKGTGLGLATVHAIVKGHGGFVEVRSEPGSGSGFDVYLPAHAGDPASTPARRSSSAPRGRGELLLVVDDEPSVREVARRVLEASDYRVLLASNGEEALRVCRQHAADLALVLTDMMMPVMNGIDFMRAVRAAHPPLRLVAMTGLHDTDSFNQAALLGVTEFLPKPFEAADLLKTLRHALDREAPSP